MVGAEFRGGGGVWRAMQSFGLHVLLGRWFMAFASGSTYIFSVYSNDIKSTLGYDQTWLNQVSFFKDLSSNIGVLFGLINEITPPWVVLLIGAIMNLFGYLMIWLSVTGRVAKPKLWQMCLYIYMHQCKLTSICIYWSFSHFRYELPRKPWQCHRPSEEFCWYKWCYSDTTLLCYLCG